MTTPEERYAAMKLKIDALEAEIASNRAAAERDLAEVEAARAPKPPAPSPAVLRADKLLARRLPNLPEAERKALAAKAVQTGALTDNKLGEMRRNEAALASLGLAAIAQPDSTEQHEASRRMAAALDGDEYREPAPKPELSAMDKLIRSVL